MSYTKSQWKAATKLFGWAILWVLGASLLGIVLLVGLAVLIYLFDMTPVWTKVLAAMLGTLAFIFWGCLDVAQSNELTEKRNAKFDQPPK